MHTIQSLGWASYLFINNASILQGCIKVFTNDIYNVTKEIIQTNAFELSISQTFMKIKMYPQKYEAAKTIYINKRH